jgi:hypothetical protein
MTEECCASGGNIMILLGCSGGSNVGQLSNQTAVELPQEGFGKKNKDFNLKREEIDRVKEAVKNSCVESLSTQTATGSSMVSCCSQFKPSGRII